MASPTTTLLLPLPLLLFLLASTTPSSTAAIADHEDDGLTHIHLYVHETYTGPNATAAAVLQSPLGANTSSFGSMGVVDDEIRAGPDRSSALLGRYQGVFFGTSLELGKGYLSAITLLFTAGEYAGSSLAVQGPILGFTAPSSAPSSGGPGNSGSPRGTCCSR
ncbi:hypothetical protein U9M48_000980 [Paspalum notatum var. saurae]|uniref:Dirigent protein n=1 Tax=Paspalum notatum var. saurae TaxID=547442 RepID=A0AAQ3PHI3_PASNO